MNIYDTANRLASEIKQSEEYVNYKMAKEALNLNSELKKKLVNLRWQDMKLKYHKCKQEKKMKKN